MSTTRNTENIERYAFPFLPHLSEILPNSVVNVHCCCSL